MRTRPRAGMPALGAGYSQGAQPPGRRAGPGWKGQDPTPGTFCKGRRGSVCWVALEGDSTCPGALPEPCLSRGWGSPCPLLGGLQVLPSNRGHQPPLADSQQHTGCRVRPQTGAQREPESCSCLARSHGCHPRKSVCANSSATCTRGQEGPGLAGERPRAVRATAAEGGRRGSALGGS